MAEAAIDPEQTAALRDAARAIDRAHVRQTGSFHLAMVMGALTLWGAAETWAQVTGWGLAQAVAIVNAVVAAYVIGSTVHEWGHFAGARLSGATSPAFEEPRRHFFMFDFPLGENSTRQFAWMSWGGILAPWAAVVAVAVLVPLELLGGAVLLSTLVYKAVAAGAFEVPIVMRTAKSGEPGAELGKQATGGGIPRSRRIGLAAGLVCFALIQLAV